MGSEALGPFRPLAASLGRRFSRRSVTIFLGPAQSFSKDAAALDLLQTSSSPVLIIPHLPQTPSIRCSLASRAEALHLFSFPSCITVYPCNSLPTHTAMQRAMSSRVRASALSSAASKYRAGAGLGQQLRFAHKVRRVRDGFC